VPAHGLRGTHARLAVEAGISGDVMAASLAHESFAVTAAHYAGTDAVADAAADRVARALNYSLDVRTSDSRRSVKCAPAYPSLPPSTGTQHRSSRRSWSSKTRRLAGRARRRRRRTNAPATHAAMVKKDGSESPVAPGTSQPQPALAAPPVWPVAPPPPPFVPVLPPAPAEPVVPPVPPLPLVCPPAPVSRVPPEPVPAAPASPLDEPEVPAEVPPAPPKLPPLPVPPELDLPPAPPPPPTPVTSAPVSAPAPTPTSAAPSDYTVYFDFDSWTLTAEDLAVITNAINTARAGGQSHITVVGHTDTSGSAAYNQLLSVRRANVVVEALVDMGARRAAIQASGVGKTDLAVPTPDGVKEAKNRRGVITLIP